MVTSIADASNIFIQCYQCRVCSGSCPKARVLPGFLPRRMVFEMINGFEERQLGSGLGWECLTCGKCQVHCPQGIDIAGWMASRITKTMMLILLIFSAS